MDTFVDALIADKKLIVKALVYSALLQGLRSGVRPYTGNPPLEEGDTPPKRVVFIEYPQETLSWLFADNHATFLDSLPQHES